MRDYEMTPDKKYQNDPAYRQFVDMVRYQLRQSNYTPTEIREACILACTMHEMETVRPIMVAKIDGWYPKPPHEIDNSF